MNAHQSLKQSGQYTCQQQAKPAVKSEKISHSTRSIDSWNDGSDGDEDGLIAYIAPDHLAVLRDEARVIESELRQKVSQTAPSASATSAQNVERVNPAPPQCVLPLHTTVQVVMEQFDTPLSFRVRFQNASGAEQLVHCSLGGLAPVNGAEWSPGIAQDIYSTLSLPPGSLCRVTCLDNSTPISVVQLTTMTGCNLADKMIEVGLARPKPSEKFAVSQSLHSSLHPGDRIKVKIEVSSVDGVDNFYAQISGDLVKQQICEYLEMEPRLQHYSSNVVHKPPFGYRAEVGDYVLAPYGTSWYRGRVSAADDSHAIIEFIDYGNISPLLHQQILPLPRQFAQLPSIAPKCRLHGVRDASCQEDVAQAIKTLKALASDLMDAEVRAVSQDVLTIDLFDSACNNVRDTLLRAGHAVKVDMPSEGTGSADLDLRLIRLENGIRHVLKEMKELKDFNNHLREQNRFRMLPSAARPQKTSQSSR